MFEAIYHKVITDLEQRLPQWLVYHNAFHTKYVLKQACSIATKEKVTERERLLVKIAALYHDTGFLVQREDHERLGCTIAFRDLQDTAITTTEVDLICGMIRATRIPQRPHTLLEQIVADADLEYLGTAHFEEYSNRLNRELHHWNPELTSQEWDEMQIAFLSEHTYHTRYCTAEKEPIKQKNLSRIKARLLAYGK